MAIFKKLSKKLSTKGINLDLYLRLLKYIRPYSLRFTYALICMGFYGLFSAAPIYFVKNVLDDIFINHNRTFLYLIPPFIVILYLLKGLANYGVRYYMRYVGQSVIRDIRNQLYRHIENMPLQFFSKSKTGDLMSRVLNDVSTMEQAVSNVLSDLLRESFAILCFVVLLFILNWRFAIIAFIVLPLSIWPVHIISKKIRHISRKTQEQMSDMSSILQETISGIAIVKAFVKEEFEFNRFAKANQKYFDNSMRATKASSLQTPIMEFLGSIAAALIIFLGGLQVMSGVMTTGTFFAFVGALFSMYAPFKKLGQINFTIQTALAASSRVFEMLDTKAILTEAPGAIELPPFSKSIEFKNVSFKYEDELILKNINLKINKGEVVAIVGSSGAGKTSLVNLLPRFYDPCEGQILIDGIDIKKVTFASLRSQIGIVTQDTILFNDTLENNIAYGAKDYPRERLEASAKAACCDEFIYSNALPDNFNTIIGDRGVRLSGGQRQRISIARAIFKNPPILILDEATSSLDTESEMMVQQALKNLMENRTTLIIAHRLSTIRNVDRIIVLENGSIVEEGAHEELMKRGGAYKKLYELQFAEVDSAG